MQRARLLAAMFMLGAAAVAASDSPFIFGPDEVVPKSVKPGEKWREGRVELPNWPRDNDLIPLALDRASPQFDYYIDGASLSTGVDQVVRYTLVAETQSGARNISFEGIRCTPQGAFRIYAFGQGDRFSPTSNPMDWQRIDRPGADPARLELWRHYLCVPRLFKPRTRSQQLRMLRSGRVPEIDNSGFLAE